MTEFRGARGSNTGDDFHELWAARQAIRLLLNEDGLEAIAVEGVSARDARGSPQDTWDGVDCTQYFGGRSATDATKVRIEQLKYSAANPKKPWTIARLVSGKTRARSVMGRLAKAWKGLATLGSTGPSVRAVLISNQPFAQEVLSAVERAAAQPFPVPPRKPKATDPPEVRLAYATGLTTKEFQNFASALAFEGGTDSRIALEEQVLQAIAEWTDLDIRGIVTGLAQFIRRKMMPEAAGELITRESVLLQLGISDGTALFPCPSEVVATENPVSRAPVRQAIGRLNSGSQYLCLHGRAGVGKTTALQEIEARLPAGSIMLKYDCYGGGRYLDPSELRHRPSDAFLQLTNELAARLKLPLFVSRQHGSDYPRVFAKRLGRAAEALAGRNADALIVIAIDAADNAIVAAKSRNPVDECFIRDFVRLSSLAKNVRFIITARTGRLDQLSLPPSYSTIEVEPFSQAETAESVSHVWNAPESWVEDFHHLSGGVPRVQAYALKVEDAHPSTALDRLRPTGKTLEEIFRQQFSDALSKNGMRAEVAKLCAGLIALPRPVPLAELAAVLDSSEAQLVDVCLDLAPGVRIQDATVGFADEDFENFIRIEAQEELPGVRQSAAERLLSRADHDRYAALNVAAALVAADRGSDLLKLVESEPAPLAVLDPILRREAELQRLRLAIKVCREAADVPRALRFVLIGAEGIKTEAALRTLLADNPDLSARYAHETAGRLILSDPDRIEDHGPFLFHRLSVDADQGDAISFREGRRSLQAWLQARKDRQDQENDHHSTWDISISDISSEVEATLKLDGPTASLQVLGGWTPKRVALEVALTLPYRLITERRGTDVDRLANSDHLGPLHSLFLLIPLALAGQPIDVNQMACGLDRLVRRKLRLKQFFDSYSKGPSTHGEVLDAALTACEILAIKGAAPELVDKALASFLRPELRRINQRRLYDAFKLDLLFRAYALRETRAGQTPSAEHVFEPPPALTEEDEKRQKLRAEREDRDLTETTKTVFGMYAAVADAIVNRRPDAELEDALSRACARIERDPWRISPENTAHAVRGYAAKSIVTLLAAGHAPPMIKRLATRVHGRWQTGDGVLNETLVSRLSLWPQLHESLVDDLSAAANEIRTMRIGAEEKSETLVRYARFMKPLSGPDANAIFNSAIEVANELDREVTTQISLLHKLVSRGVGKFADSRETARHFSNIVSDAAIRLEGQEHFPWDDAMSALALMDAPLALANVARWHDEGNARLDETLAPMLKTALGGLTIRPVQAAALILFLDYDDGVMTEALKQSGGPRDSTLSGLAEEAAYDVLMRDGCRGGKDVAQYIEQRQLHGPWTGALLRQQRFLAELPLPQTTKHDYETSPNMAAEDSLSTHVWNRETLIENQRLQEAVLELENRERVGHRHLSFRAILESARKAVSPGDRVQHLKVLAELDEPMLTDDAVAVLLRAVNEWRGRPSVDAWCHAELSEVIVARFPELTRYLPYQDNLTPALERTGLSDAALQELVLRGIERHVDGFDPELIFALTGLVGCRLPPSEAAGLVDWYARRLAERIPTEDRDQTVSLSALPQQMDEAVARFLFAYMGDCDLRLRWRAAHAVRRLARTGDQATLKALVTEYPRREEAAFRGRDLAFYWLAARLWFVMAWDRVSGERPDVGSCAARALLQIALDDSFPHLLVRSFARDACEKLVTAGHLSLTNAEASNLSRVNETTLPQAPRPVTTGTLAFGGGFGTEDTTRRFKFDWTDAIPYWYEPVLESFADVDGERFLQEVERWTIDVWGYSGDTRDLNKEPRRRRLGRSNWALTQHSHGAKPTLERLNVHLEWHAMWCAAGELLKTRPLALHDEDDWHSLPAQVDQEKLVEPPLWSADLLAPVPLDIRNWRRDTTSLENWVLEVGESVHRAELFASDSQDDVIVDGLWERRTDDRIERTRVSSALVDPSTGGSLLRALQTMDDNWDYKLPDEGERHEIEKPPYRLLGWLQRSYRDTSIDEKDPLRGYAFCITSQPGKRVATACKLTRDATGRAIWSNRDAERAMFVYEAWGEPEKDGDPYTSGVAAAGDRLLVHKEQLLNYLRGQGLDLIIEVEVTRRGRETRRYADEERKATPEARFTRLYRLDNRGGIEVAEGRLGTWTGDRPTT